MIFASFASLDVLEFEKVSFISDIFFVTFFSRSLLSSILNLTSIDIFLPAVVELFLKIVILMNNRLSDEREDDCLGGVATHKLVPGHVVSTRH